MIKLQRVFEPLQIGRVTIPNRIVRTPHGTSLAHGNVNDTLIAYHVARARGGVGLSYIEYTSVHPSSISIGTYSWDDSHIAGCRKLVEAVKPYGMKMFQQLAHGGYMYPPADGSPPWSASAMPCPLNGLFAVPMTKEQIEIVIEAFGQAARRANEAGIEGIEIHAGHGYLMHQFLSPLTNHREDEYGGSLENRMRFLVQVLKRVRKAVEPGFPIGIRLSDQLHEGGLTPEDCAEIAGKLEADGLIDYLNGSQGSYYALPAMLPAMERPLGSMLSSSAKIVQGVKRIPRILTAARVRTLEEAEQMLRDGLGDMIGLNRAHIADPDLIRKTREGRVDEVRPCIACNQGCVGGLQSMVPRLGCAINPAVGFEETLDESLIVRTQAPKKVMVIGGGPAGMEAARVAALIGHKVTLVEASSDLGGAAAVAKLAPRMHTFGDFLSWQEREIRRLGVDVKTETYVEAADVIAAKPDAVIVATGGEQRMDGVNVAMPSHPIQGMQQAHVLSGTDVLTDKKILYGKTALIFDDVGGYEAVGVAEALIEKGVAVTYVTRCMGFAPTVELWTRTEGALERLNKGNFEVLIRSQLASIGNGECEVRTLHGPRTRRIPADHVVIVLARVPRSQLHDELRGKVPNLSIVGDALAARDIQAAIREAHRTARALQ